METKLISMKKPIVDPFSYHLYIGGDFKLSWFMRKCAQELENNGFTCSLKYDFLFPDTSIINNLNLGIRESYRCLVLITHDYEKELFAKQEIKYLKEKVDRFTTSAVRAMYLADNIQEKYFDELISVERNDLTLKLDLVIDKLKYFLSEKSMLNLALLPKLNLGAGAAFGYFYGFLRIILPDMKDKFFEKTLNGDENRKKNAVSKFLIIVPEDCKGLISLNVKGKIETTEMYVVTAATRAGTKCRDYKSSVHQITDSKGAKYYFVGEFPTPTLTMYESFIYGKCGFTFEQLCNERNVFFTTLAEILNAYSETADTYRLIYWRNLGENDEITFYNLLLDAVLKEIGGESTKAKGHYKRPSILSQIQPMYDLHEATVANPKGKGYLQDWNGTKFYFQDERFISAIYDKNIFSFDKFENKGLCLSFIFSKGYESEPRPGFQADKENIKNTFENLRFDTIFHEDLSTEDLKVKLNDLEEHHWKKYGSVVCCISSHGKNGNIATTTSWISIGEIMSYFSCSSFKGKPKIFFIQCCLNDLIPREDGFLVLFSCLPGSVAFRSKSCGSILFQTVRECLLPNMEINDCMGKIAEMTNAKVMVIKGSNQHPWIIKSFNKPVYL